MKKTWAICLIFALVSGVFLLSQDQTLSEMLSQSQKMRYDTLRNGSLTYIDPRGRFRFSYPTAFGEASAGTNQNFPGTNDKGYSIKFTDGMKGMNAVVTSGRVWVIAQALGGLHDSIMLGGIIEVLPTPLRTSLLAHASFLKLTNFCEELSKKKHIEPNNPAFTSLPSVQKTVILNLDQTRNIDLEVIRCEVSEDIVTFHKEATFKSGKFENRQHIYGAIRFLEAPFSSFQLFQVITASPNEQLLQDMSAVVRSFTYLD